MPDLPGPEGGAARRPSGELEASVLAALWAAGGRPLTPAEVQRDLGTDLARTTVTTILARLYEKGTVSRARAGRGYSYLPVQDSPGLAARRMRTELDKSASDDRGTVLARFVSGLNPADEALLRELLWEGEPGAGAAPDGGGAGRSAAVGDVAGGVAPSRSVGVGDASAGDVADGGSGAGGTAAGRFPRPVAGFDAADGPRTSPGEPVGDGGEGSSEPGGERHS